MSNKIPVAIIGSGNIGTDLLIKMLRSDVLDPVALIGIDPESDGLRRARDMGVEGPHTGIDWVEENADAVKMVFDASSAYVHIRNDRVLKRLGIDAIDLTPAAIGPKVIPPVNLAEHLNAPNINMVTCGGQATTPIVHAISRVTPVPYAEMVSTVSSRSAGPGTRQNIDEFTRTTSLALEEIGGAQKGKAIIILNPAEPPIMMRNTVMAGIGAEADHDAIIASVLEMEAAVSAYVPGYRLANRPVIEKGPFQTPGGEAAYRVVVLLEVTGAGDYLPTYAGNLDIMTAAALRVGEAKAHAMIGATV